MGNEDALRNAKELVRMRYREEGFDFRRCSGD
jgi:hypothetical protein